MPFRLLVGVFVLLLSASSIDGGMAFHYLTLSSNFNSMNTCVPSGSSEIDFISIRGERHHNHRRTIITPVPPTTLLMTMDDEIPRYETTSTTSTAAAKKGILYNIPHSGWKSPQWNWGSARGTGHDCAAICRSRWSNKEDRRKLVHSLLSPEKYHAKLHPSSSIGEVSFEEIKLILGLAWQRGRWDGTDGGPQGYRSVLQTMADARRYENENEILSALHFIEDVSAKYQSISRNAEELHKMKEIAFSVLHGKKTHASKEEIFMARRMCAGMVLDAMHFVENGL